MGGSAAVEKNKDKGGLAEPSLVCYVESDPIAARTSVVLGVERIQDEICI